MHSKLIKEANYSVMTFCVPKKVPELYHHCNREYPVLLKATVHNPNSTIYLSIGVLWKRKTTGLETHQQPKTEVLSAENGITAVSRQPAPLLRLFFIC